ncbi:MAG: cupin domain-containing protein [Acidiferrobacterales bacterium]|nr:cupin domain-containing protein [Acidiferrobacterales bacterium]
MKINADFSQRVVVHSDEMEWVDSPMPGVWRRPLDRVGNEVARATTIVKYDPDSQFSPHVHKGGEEFLVLDGVFQDEHGDFPVGSYIRNPPQSSHTPGSKQGCVIFVKLWQFAPSDRTHVRLSTNHMQSVESASQSGIEITPLYIDEREEVCLQTWSADATVSIPAITGLEVLVLDGQFEERGDTFKKHSWLRLPGGEVFEAKPGPGGAKVWIKMNHLGDVKNQITRINM